MFYLDCNATTPIETEVLDLMIHFLKTEYGNAGSRTHQFGRNAASAVSLARTQVASVVACDVDDVIFTSGATEANNLALLGLEVAGRESKRMHIVSTLIEHKAVLEPLERLQRSGFEVEFVKPDRQGGINALDVLSRIRSDTLVVSVMHANNETGALQPIAEIAVGMKASDAYLHVDAAQSFGKDLTALRSARIDMLSASAHKLYGPKGVGCLVVRKRQYKRVPLRPLMVGGGQERGLRPGTLPVPLIAAFGEACKIALRDHAKRQEANRQTFLALQEALSTIPHRINSDPEAQLLHVANVTFPGVDSEAMMVLLKENIACSNGAACTSHSYEKSHVLRSMGLDDVSIGSTLRLSWSHLTGEVDWTPLTLAIEEAKKIA